MRVRPLLYAAAPSLMFLAASLGWALYDQLRHPLWPITD